MSNLYRGPSKDEAVSEEKIFLEINQSETRIACGGHVCIWIGTKLALFIEDRP
jgi:hypothetical protein